MRGDPRGDPRRSPQLDARPLAAPPPRALAVPECPGAGAGHLALHGAEGLAEDAVLLLLPLPVSGGARCAREGAPGQQ